MIIFHLKNSDVNNEVRSGVRIQPPKHYLYIKRGKHTGTNGKVCNHNSSYKISDINYRIYLRLIYKQIRKTPTLISI